MSSHSHHHHNHDSSKRMGWAFFLNVGFTIIEFIGGWLTNSTAIMADAVHDLGDSLSIGTAWCLNIIGAKQASKRFTYGYKRLSLLGALINALVMIGGSSWVLMQAIPRLFDPQMPNTEGMLGLALLGVTVNAYAAYKLSAGKSLNERVLSWHMIEDVLGWLAVLIVSIVLMFVDWPILDPLLSIAFTLFILFNVLLNLRETVGLFLQATPDEDIQQSIKQNLLSLAQISDLHHLHFWSLDGEHHVLTVHLVLKNMLTSVQLTDLKTQIARQLADYQLAHTTIEFEFPDEACRDE
jgi:cobalt-zinc-cadmium efflux system protein